MKTFGIRSVDNFADIQPTSQVDNELKIQDTTHEPMEYTGKSISAFQFNGAKCQVDTWKGLLVKTLEIIYSKHGKDFDKILNMPGKKRQYFSYDSQLLDTPQKFDDTNIFMETKLSSKAIVKLTYEVIKLFGYTDADLTIEMTTKEPKINGK